MSTMGGSKAQGKKRLITNSKVRFEKIPNLVRVWSCHPLRYLIVPILLVISMSIMGGSKAQGKKRLITNSKLKSQKSDLKRYQIW